VKTVYFITYPVVIFQVSILFLFLDIPLFNPFSDVIFIKMNDIVCEKTNTNYDLSFIDQTN